MVQNFTIIRPCDPMRPSSRIATEVPIFRTMSERLLMCNKCEGKRETFAVPGESLMARVLRRRGRRTAEADDHDEVALSGWLFADLILGLLIVFLGAVSVRAIVMPDPEPEAAEEREEGLGEATVCVTAMSNDWVQIEVPRGVGGAELIRVTEERIAAALSERDDVDGDAVFPFAMFFGRPDPGTPDVQRPARGQQNAASVRSVVLDGLPGRFANSAFRDFYTGAGDASNVRLDLFPEVTVCR